MSLFSFPLYAMMARTKTSDDGTTSETETVSPAGLTKEKRAGRDNSGDGFPSSGDCEKIEFTGAYGGAKHLFVVENVFAAKSPVRQITSGDFDIAENMGQSGTTVVVSRTNVNHTVELNKPDMFTGNMQQHTHVNEVVSASLETSKAPDANDR